MSSMEILKIEKFPCFEAQTQNTITPPAPVLLSSLAKRVLNRTQHIFGDSSLPHTSTKLIPSIFYIDLEINPNLVLIRRSTFALTNAVQL